MARKMWKATLSMVSLLVSSPGFSHGEQKPGPHGGHIRMPGAFHTEVVLQTKSLFRLYLLDMVFKNPVTDKSTVKTVLKTTTEAGVTCTPVATYFECELPSGFNLESGVLEVRSSRHGVFGLPVTYQLPLRFSDATH